MNTAAGRAAASQSSCEHQEVSLPRIRVSWTALFRLKSGDKVLVKIRSGKVRTLQLAILRNGVPGG